MNHPWAPAYTMTELFTFVPSKSTLIFVGSIRRCDQNMKISKGSTEICKLTAHW